MRFLISWLKNPPGTSRLTWAMLEEARIVQRGHRLTLSPTLLPPLRLRLRGVGSRLYLAASLI